MGKTSVLPIFKGFYIQFAAWKPNTLQDEQLYSGIVVAFALLSVNIIISDIKHFPLVFLLSMKF